MSNVLPYKCEYSLSDRAECKLCKNRIGKNQLRLASMVRSKHFDGFQPFWYHYNCFFIKQTPTGSNQFFNFENIRFEDQKLIENSIDTKIQSAKGGKKRTRDEASEKNIYFKAEYVKSNNSKCNHCETEISKGIVRLGKLDNESDDAKTFGPFYRWFCLKCFIFCRDELEFHDDISAAVGFDELEEDDKKSLRAQIKRFCMKNIKKEFDQTIDQAGSNNNQENDYVNRPELYDKLKIQSDQIYSFIDKLRSMRKKDFTLLFNENNINYIPENNERKYEIIADAMMFGIPENCSICNGTLQFKNFRYECTGDLDVLKKCNFKTDTPIRKPLVIPKDSSLLSYDFLNYYQPIIGQRLVDPSLKSKFIQAELTKNGKFIQNEKNIDSIKPKIENIMPLFSGFTIAVIGRLNVSAGISEHGGIVANNVEAKAALAVCSEIIFKQKKLINYKRAEMLKIPMLSSDFFYHDHSGKTLIEAIEPFLLTDWDIGKDQLEKRFEKLCTHNNICKVQSVINSNSKDKSTGNSFPDSGLDKETHLLNENGSIYSAKLNRTSLETDINSFYIMKILQEDENPENIYFFRTWGRIGVKTNDCKTIDRLPKETAISMFENLFFDKTQNQWSNRKNFIKKNNAYLYTEEFDNDDVLMDEFDLITTTSQIDSGILDMN